VHDVATQGGAPVILDGKPMTAASAVRLARALSKRAAQGGFVPFNLLYMDDEMIAWWVPPACRHIAFRAPELGAAERGEVVPHPGLVFAVGHGRQWRVWAVKGSERPTEQAALYQAPYFNVSGDGVICTGNVSLPNRTSAEKIEAWNTAFFGSFFTHPNANGKLLTYRGGAYKFWRDMLDGKHAEFPERVLVASGETLRQAIAPRSER
jgi:PRTRC genetic system protein B